MNIPTKLERILKIYKSTIKSDHGGTLTGVSMFNFLKNNDKIMDEIWKLFVGAINNHENDGRTLLPTTIEEFDMVLNIHRELFKYQDFDHLHLQVIKPTRE